MASMLGPPASCMKAALARDTGEVLLSLIWQTWQAWGWKGSASKPSPHPVINTSGLSLQP